MFFNNKLVSIRKDDRVLEVGPGATPFYRSDVFLELNYSDEKERIAQSGHVGILKSDKPIVYYEGDKFPFADNEFDYIICSHVLEHVKNIDSFVLEMTRVAKRGYIEFPTSLYDYLYDFPEHENFCFYKNNLIYWGKKSDFQLDSFKPLSSILYQTLQLEYYDFVDSFRELFFQGFEWNNSIQTKKTNEIELLIFPEEESKSLIKHAMLSKKNLSQEKKSKYLIFSKVKNRIAKLLKRLN